MIESGQVLNNTYRPNSGIILGLRLCAVVALLLIVCLGFAQNRPLRQGSQPYTPTRLEWLAGELNSTLRVELSVESQYAMVFASVEKDDAILIQVLYFPGVNREVMNSSIETAKKIIAIQSKAKGWTWLKVQEKIELKDDILPAGFQPYTPSRLEWLASELNSTLRVELSSESQYSMHFVPVADDAILIDVTYFPGVQREIMNGSIETAREAIAMKSNIRGWTWLKVQEKIEMKELNTPR